uniref:Talin-1 n=1 Tax=Anas platyrhynchos TaxID=8839 RepID=A0A8B9ZIR0_ANAPL
MVALSLKISIGSVVKTMQFEPSTMVYDACCMIQERVPKAQMGQSSDFGLFLLDEDPKKGIWLEAGKALDYYMLRNGDTMEYKKKQWPLKIRKLDGTVKTVMVDDSKTITDILMTICTRIGITNYDEYSLEVTGTLKKDETLLRDEKKMEKLKQKLHTDDELNWLDHGRTLCEQGIDDETLLLRRKFFYSDQNVDSQDLVQLNLLYVQARNDILNGSHPVSFDKACEFAGYQCQIQFGPHNEQKHKPVFLELKDFLPKEYIKQKGERKIFMAHKNCGNISEIEAKVRYMKLAHSLKTYGVSFFLVKEKMKGKNKLVPRLLGITKECVMCVDEKTKEVIQEWSLTNIKCWAASPKSFTLDFGDYQDDYYSVQTMEGEQIAQLIAGYIDIILKKKKSKDHFGLEGDEESTMLEDSVSPKNCCFSPFAGQLLQQQFNCVGKADLGSVALPAIMRTGAGGPENLQVGTMPQAQLQITSGQMHRGHMPPLTSAQQALTGTINSSMQAVNAAQATLDDFETLPPFGQNAVSKAWCKNKMDESKHEIHSQVDAITAGTASVVNLTSGDPADTDYTAVGCAVTTISSNLTEMSKGVKLLAALMEDEGGNGWQLLQAAKNLASAISDLLKTAQPASAELHQNLLQAAGLVGQTSGELLQQIGETNAAAALVLKAKNVAQKTEDSVLQAQVILAATQCALSTSQLVACTKVVAPTISSPVCQEQLIEAGKLVAKSAESCVEASKATTSDDQLLKQVGVATTTVNQALNDLLQHIKQHATGGQPIGCYDQATDTILSVTENIWVMQVRVREMVRQAHILAQATSNLVNAIKADAEGETDLENSRKLLSAAKILADATAKMVEAAKIRAAAHPDSEEQQQWLQEAAEGLRMATNAVAQNAIKNKLVHKLEHVAKQAATSATQTIAAAQHAAASNKNPVVQQQLVQSCKVVADQIPMLVQGVRGSQLQLDSPSAQLALIAASQNFLQVPPNLLLAGETGTLGGKGRNHICGRIKLPVQDPETDRTVSMSSSKLLLAAKALSADPTAPNLKNQLAAAARAVTDSINQLITMCIQQASGQKECDNALRELEAVKELLENPIQAVNDMSYFNCLDSVMENSKMLDESMAGISQNAKNSKLPEFRESVSAASKALCGLTEAAAQAAYLVGVSDLNSQAGQQGLVDPTQFARANQAIQMACQNLVDPASTQSQVMLSAATIVAKHTSALCNTCRLAFRTANPVEVANSTANLVKTIKALDGTFNEENRERCRTATAPLIEAMDNLTAFASNPEFATVPAQISSEGCRTMEPIVSSAKTMLESSSGLIQTDRSLAVNPKDPLQWSVLASHSRTVSDSIKKLITNMRDKAPGQRECDEAIDILNRCMQEVDQPSLEASSWPLEKALHNQMITAVQEINNLIEPVASAAWAEASQLGHKVSQMAQYFEPLILAAIGAASKTPNHQQQMNLLDQTKTLAESALQMLYTTKEAGGNPKVMGEPEGTFVDYQITMVKMAKAIAVTVQEMIGSHIKCRVQELGHGCTTLVTKAGALQCSPSDAYTKKELIESACKVSKKVSHVLAALQAGNRGTQACITAASAVSGIIADLDTTIMFATAGILNQENSETFADHREGILKTARALVEDTKVLVQNAMANQEKLAQAAQSSVTTITHLAEVVKLGAAILGSEDPETQLGWGVVLISAVKDVAKALGDLISATKAAAGKAGDDPTVYQLKNSAKVMVTNVTSLLKTVKTVEDEATKGMRALEATIEHIHQELVVFSSPVPPAQVSTPEDFIRMTKGITMATDKAVAAGNSCRQEDVIAMANLSRCAIADMLHACKEAAYHPEVSADVRQWALRFDRECAGGYLELLEHVLVILQKPTHELKQQLAGYSKRVASSVTELIQAAEAMKGMEWVDPEDPKVIAENELLGAAAAIEAVSKKLEQLKPRAKPKQADESLDFEKQILEAAKSIVAAMSALVKAASAAQRELVAQGKVGAIPANAVDDGQWSQGLISAACMVAAATNNLCEAANVAVQGHASEEKLILSDKQVAASTAQLLVACKVKADHDSDAMMRLQVSPRLPLSPSCLLQAPEHPCGCLKGGWW